MMLMANGQRPTPKIWPSSVLLRPNSRIQTSLSTIWARMMNPNAVAIRAMKLPQNRS